ncbi:MAG: isoleucine--tRNA ligase [Clostridiales bacterium]|nr:isoleucine--tRNA ligase [Clostridiales bacterium]
MYKKVAELNLPRTEKEILSFWRQNDVKSKCLQHNKGKEIFSFFEGPPTANGIPHAGHVLTRALKDVFNRAKSMQGYYVPRKGGWDTHGLPVEISVEKEIGISGKQEIEKYGVEKFIEACKKDVWKYVDLWKDFSERVGYFVNMDDDCYVTYHDDYIESVWWSLKELDKKGLLYKGYKVLPSCPSCGTALSSHEVAQGYKERNDLTAVAKFKALDEENTYYLAWTTTPWTLPSNVALAVNPKETYVKLTFDGVNYIMAEALIGHYFEKDYEVVAKYTGKELERRKYEPLFDFAGEKARETGYYVTCAEYVTLTDGTGIVHIAPAYGADDNAVGMEYNLPFVQLAGSDGNFKAGCGKYSGRNVFEVNEEIAFDLKSDGKIFKLEKHKHEYPHCWRCKSPLIYFARDGWFVRTTAIKDQLIANNKSVNWFPDTIKTGRMGNWLENVIDWCLSRDRYWGTPLPVWKCECGHYHVIGSREELRTLCGLDHDIELHKPYVDEVTITCEKCGGVMRREADVIDCWYDSGSMPFAQFHYPFENKDEFERRFPANFISEGVDQCRGWFYTQLVLGTALFGASPFRNCIANGMVVDDNGVKLSKSLGNYRPPLEIIDEVGADAVRWSFYTTTQPWNNQPMSVKSAGETIKNFFGTLWNTYAFYVLYAEIDEFDPSKYTLSDCKLSIMDKWILSEYNQLVRKVTEELNAYHCTEASREIQVFVDNLSNWYIRRCRKRYWGSGFAEDKKSAFVTLYTVLDGLTRLCAPFAPFVTEEIYQNITRPFYKGAPDSVHLCDYPTVDEKYIDEKLTSDMALTYKFTELGRSARNLSNIKIRQPLSKLYVTDGNGKSNLSNDLLDQIKEELNVKEIVENENLDQFVNYSLKPNLRTLGPKYGKVLGAIREYLLNADAREIMSATENGTYTFTVADTEVVLTADDILSAVTQKEGFASATEGSLAIVLDTHITEELLIEGIAREFVSKVQAMRKATTLEVTDRIVIEIAGDEKLVNIILGQKESIMQDILTTDIKVSNVNSDDVFEYDNMSLKIAIHKA